MFYKKQKPGRHWVGANAPGEISCSVARWWRAQAAGELRGRYAGNLSQCMVRLVKERGLGGLYTGFLASIAVSAPSSAVFAVGYEFSKNALESTPLHQFAPVLAAALGNVTASIVRVPPEVIKQRVQAAVYKWDFTFLPHVLLSRLFQIKIKSKSSNKFDFRSAVASPGLMHKIQIFQTLGLASSELASSERCNNNETEI